MSSFQKNQLYTRPALAALVGHPSAGRKGGDWYTGYARWNDEFFIFCNVGTPGKTGHDYANRWDGKELEWFGKTNSRIDTPSMSAMLSEAFPIHVFWRSKLDTPFTYAGLAKAVEVRNTTPVEVRWAFDVSTIQALGQGSKMPTWRRGPPPSVGTQTIVKYDGPTHLYLMTLGGPGALIPHLHNGDEVIKVGITNDLARRLADLNFGFPPGSSVKWRLHQTRLFPSGQAAFEEEGRILDALRLARRSIGGEFAIVPRAELESVLTLELGVTAMR